MSTRRKGTSRPQAPHEPTLSAEEYQASFHVSYVIEQLSKFGIKPWQMKRVITTLQQDHSEGFTWILLDNRYPIYFNTHIERIVSGQEPKNTSNR